MADFNKHVLIFGSARSGTSWLAETVARRPRYRLLFEPEHEYNTKQGRLICDKYIPVGHSSPEINQYFRKLFSNRIDNDWIAQSSNRKFKRHLWPFIPKKYIIKFVRCNLLAHYIFDNFKVPYIHLIRNPYDVVQSQQRVKFPWLLNLSYFLEQEDLVELLFSKFNFDLHKYKDLSALEILITRWCIENVIPLKNQDKYPNFSKVVRHEEIRNDMRQFITLCEFFNLQPVKNLEEVYFKPSTKTHPQSEIYHGGLERKFSATELQKINRVLDIFQCELYPRIS